MRGTTSRTPRWGSCLVLLLLAALMWVSAEESTQERSGLTAVFALSLFVSLGFILFGRDRMDTRGKRVVPKD